VKPDVSAAADEEPFGRDPAGLLFRHILQERLRRLFPPRSRVLILGAGENAPFLAAAGVDVQAIDAAPATAFAESLGSRRDLDGACCGPGALNGADLDALGRTLARALRPGAPVLLCFRGRRSPGLREARERLGPDFVWRDAFALGVLVPGASRAAWVDRHPQAFGILAALEGIVRGWPLLRARGDYLAIEGVRR